MAFRMGTAGPLVLAGIVIYIFTLVAQGRAAVSLCDRYSVGTQIEDVENLDGTFFLTRMGPLPDTNNPAVQSVIFCANMTMCDTSCSLEIEDKVVKSARYLAH
jgi:hypothetical protein